MAQCEYMMLCQIGPVQSFIAAGRRTQDLYVGSRLLSVLASAGVRGATKQSDVVMLFPVNDEDSSGEVSSPHRFAFLTKKPEETAVKVKEAIDSHWKQIADGVKNWLLEKIGGGQWEAVFDRQVQNWMEFYWVAVPNSGSHGEVYKRVNEAMAQRKNARHFPQIDEPGVKCTVTGAGQALPLDWAKLSERVGEIELRPNERLGALALVKRFAQRAGAMDERTDFPSTEDIAGLREEDKAEKQRGKELEGYFAILHMDGDRMGAKLSELKDKKAHQDFSLALAEFAQNTVKAIVTRYDNEAEKAKRGRAALVYAGGDDVLALLPVRDALRCADEIRRAYADTLRGMVEDPTMSAGIAIVPSNYPLDIALDIARKAEKSAKDDYGRDAVVVTEAHGTQRRSAGAKWALRRGDSQQEWDSLNNLIEDLIEQFEARRLSAKIGYDLSEMAYAMVVKPDKNGSSKETVSIVIPPEAREAEVRRLLKRRTETFIKGEGAQQLVDALAPRLCNWGEAERVGWDSLAKWVILARFLASGGKKEQ